MSREIYRQYILPNRNILFGIAAKMLGNEQDAEDAVQEVLLKLWLVSGSLDKYENPSAMAVTSIKNHCLDKLKTIKREETIPTDTELQTNTDNPYSMLERKNTEEILMHIINRLPKLQQLIITMKDVKDYETEEIASIMGTTVEAVRMNLSRARKKVREEYLKISTL